jgi:hypothetical protein
MVVNGLTPLHPFREIQESISWKKEEVNVMLRSFSVVPGFQPSFFGNLGKSFHSSDP